MPALYPEFVWGCCQAIVGQGEKSSPYLGNHGSSHNGSTHICTISRSGAPQALSRCKQSEVALRFLGTGFWISKVSAESQPCLLGQAYIHPLAQPGILPPTFSPPFPAALTPPYLPCLASAEVLTCVAVRGWMQSPQGGIRHCNSAPSSEKVTNILYSKLTTFLGWRKGHVLAQHNHWIALWILKFSCLLWLLVPLFHQFLAQSQPVRLLTRHNLFQDLFNPVTHLEILQFGKLQNLVNKDRSLSKIAINMKLECVFVASAKHALGTCVYAMICYHQKGFFFNGCNFLFWRVNVFCVN